jgi:ADP-ribose pyrophosphatase YjhB (NUDIX family)
MHRIIKIHIDNWIILLGSAEANKHLGFEKILCLPQDLEKLAASLTQKGRNVFIETADASKFILDSSHTMKYSVACGGLVKNNAEEILFIFRRKKWDLPKGKLDKGETLAACALREVQEETGAKNLSMLDFRTETFHLFYNNEKFILKHTYWYNMLSTDTDFTPQLEEEIEAVCWIKPAEIGKCLENSFKSIEEVILHHHI